MKPQAEDSQWEGFEHQPQSKLQKTLQPFALPTLSKTLSPTLKLINQVKPHTEEKQQTTEAQTIKQRNQTITFSKNYPRIPILRPKEDFSKYNDGALLYKGFQPSFSDKYFKSNQSQPTGPQRLSTDNLTFDSKFESGNLNRVYKNKNNAYDLYMRVDTNTQGHLQWFYFKVKSEKPQIATFTIFRFKKKISLYQRGMRPYVKSKKQGTGWRQTGYNVHYNNIQNQGKSKYYSLTFQYNFQFENDEVYFAACPPYSYSLLMSRLKQFSNNACCQVSQMGQTLGGLPFPLVTIGNEDCKNYIVITARTHPGQTSGSWVMDGILSYLVGQKAQELLKSVTFKIIPMLNPDGVYIGNYRTGIIGKDFNRSFNQAASNLMPQVSQLKSLVKTLQKNGKIVLYLDLHGHSIQRNSFIFGPQLNVFPTCFKQIILDLQSLSTLFKQKSCKLKTRSDCVQTARGYFQNIRKIFSLTIENSLGLYESHYHTYPILPDKWRLFGKQIGQVLQKCISIQFQNVQIAPSATIKLAASQLQILNKRILDKIQKRMFTQKSDQKDKDKEKEKQKQKQKQKQKIANNKFLNKKRFQMIKWKKITQIRNQALDPHKQLLTVSKKSRKLSQHIKVSQIMLKQQIQLTQSQTSKNNKRRPKPLTQQKPSILKLPSKSRFKNQDNNLYFSMREVNQSQLSKLKQQISDEIKDMQIQVQSPLMRPNKQQIPIKTSQKQQQGDAVDNKIAQLDKLSDQQSESSDINDRQSDSDDLPAQQMKSLFHTVQMINKNRVFEFQQQVEEKRINKMKQSIQKRIIKQPSYHSVPQKMEAHNKYNQLKLTLSNKSEINQFRKSFEQDKQIAAIKHRHRKMYMQNQNDVHFNYTSNPSTQLPILQQNTSSLLKNNLDPKDFKRPLIIPISRTPISNIYRGSIVQNTIRQQIITETTKKLQKLQQQSIFSSKPFQDTFIRNRSKYLDVKKKI